MAYALCDADKTVKSVALSLEHLAVTGDLTVVEIPNDVASEVLRGVRSLSRVFTGDDPAPTVTAAPRFQPRGYTDRYPSMMPDHDVDALIDLARQIPPDATCVEIGSRFGGSAKLLCEHAPYLKRLYCIDIEWKQDQRCDFDPKVADMIRRFQIDPSRSCHDFATELLAPFSQIVRLLRLDSPYEIRWWKEPVDFVFEDSSHSNPQFRDNINFWWNHVKAGGILAGHDYSPYWPDVCREVEWFTSNNGLRLNRAGTIWWVFKP